MENPGNIGLIGFVVRLMWMFLVPIAVFIVGIRIVDAREKDPASIIILWLMLLLAILSRYIDVTVLRGSTVTGDPATVRHANRYAIGAVLSGLLFALVSSLV